MKRTIWLTLIALSMTMIVYAQSIAVKTNLLYGGVALTPNLGVEIGLGKRSTLDITGGYRPWHLKGDYVNNQKMVHWLGNIEYRYWLCEKFNGHFFGIHGLVSQYNISQHNLPLLFGKGSKEFRFEGWAYGAGVSYGYQWVFAHHWSAEASLGFGYAFLTYDQYRCKKCGDKVGSSTRHYFGPSKAALSIIYTL